MITYHGYQIIGNSGEYYVLVHGHKSPKFAHYSEAESYINGLRF